ncbi:hypothetical protein ACFFIY_12335 [Bhargavaea ullalensis]|uniref:ZIP Zinc transporter n=1 Tax=Bhargavaea ullalensis TaxID=1265685 RepID=A0ABV2G7L0_9BACL
MPIGLLTLLLAAGFVLIHLFSRKMIFLDGTPRSRLLSGAGGVAVAYVFLRLLPNLADYEEELKGTLTYATNRFLEHHLYIIALAGLVIYYGLEQLAESSKRRRDAASQNGRPRIFWIHIGSFALLNLITGYLLVHGHFPHLHNRILFFVAMALNFVVNDWGLRNIHRSHYDRYGRWLLGLVILAGWAIGMTTKIDDVFISYLSAFLAGGVIMNVMKEELPKERQSSFLAFLVGVVAYSGILLAV